MGKDQAKKGGNSHTYFQVLYYTSLSKKRVFFGGTVFWEFMIIEQEQYKKVEEKECKGKVRH